MPLADRGTERPSNPKVSTDPDRLNHQLYRPRPPGPARCFGSQRRTSEFDAAVALEPLQEGGGHGEDGECSSSFRGFVSDQ